MTANELRTYINNNFINGPLPSIIYVNHETYGHVIHELIQHRLEKLNYTFTDYFPSELKGMQILIGPNGGIMFKNIELVVSIGEEE